jgi:hypothetical protein
VLPPPTTAIRTPTDSPRQTWSQTRDPVEQS